MLICNNVLINMAQKMAPKTLSFVFDSQLIIFTFILRTTLCKTKNNACFNVRAMLQCVMIAAINTKALSLN